MAGPCHAPEPLPSLRSRPAAPAWVDQLSFAVMRRFGLRETFTNDRHFRDTGFEPLF